MRSSKLGKTITSSRVWCCSHGLQPTLPHTTICKSEFVGHSQLMPSTHARAHVRHSQFQECSPALIPHGSSSVSATFDAASLGTMDLDIDVGGRLVGLEPRVASTDARGFDLASHCTSMEPSPAGGSGLASSSAHMEPGPLEVFADVRPVQDPAQSRDINHPPGDLELYDMRERSGTRGRKRGRKDAWLAEAREEGRALAQRMVVASLPRGALAQSPPVRPQQAQDLPSRRLLKRAYVAKQSLPPPTCRGGFSSLSALAQPLSCVVELVKHPAAVFDFQMQNVAQQYFGEDVAPMSSLVVAARQLGVERDFDAALRRLSPTCAQAGLRLRGSWRDSIRATSSCTTSIQFGMMKAL